MTATEHDIIDKPVKLDILNEILPQVNEIPQHFIYEIKTIAYDVTWLMYSCAR